MDNLAIIYPMSAGKVDDNKTALIKELFACGAHFGYSRARNHPSASPYIFGYKNRSAVVDLNKTIEGLEQAKKFMTELGQAGKIVIFVGNKEEARTIIIKAAESLGLPYVASRWLGGTFTNFPQIKSRIDRLIDLKTKREKGELGVYTKKERLLFDREIAGLERYLGSLTGLKELPAAVVVVDALEEAIVVAEAKKVKVPIVALCNTDCDLSLVDYPVVGNDSNNKTIAFFVKELAEAYELGKSQAVTDTTTPAPVTK